MSEFKRRKFLKTSAGIAAAAAVGPMIWVKDANAQWSGRPEKGAKLRVLRWSRFVQGDIDQYMKNVAKFQEKYGIEVRVDNEGWEDVRPKAAVAANTGAGPDIILSTNDDANLYPEKLVDVTDVCNYLGTKYGGWYPVCSQYLKPDGKKWIGVPLGCAGNALVYRASMLKAAGFDKVPKDTDGFLKLCKALKEKNTPVGFALGNATGDGNTWTNWVVWAFGGKLVDANNKVVIDSPETIKALEYCKGAVRDVRARNAVVARSEQQQGVPRQPDFADQQRDLDLLRGEERAGSEGQGTRGGHLPLELPGWTGRAPHGIQPVLQPDDLQVLEVSEGGEGVPSLHDGRRADQSVGHRVAGLCDSGAHRYEKHPVWNDPKATPYRDSMKIMLPSGYAGKMGYASAGALADFIVVNMVAEAASGSKSPKEAAERAQKRAERYYKV